VTAAIEAVCPGCWRWRPARGGAGRPGGPGESPTAAPQCAACSAHARRARCLPLEALLRLGDRHMPTADPQLTWWRLHLGSSGPLPLPAQHRQTRRDGLEAGHTWPALPDGAKRERAKLRAQRTQERGLGHPGTGSAPPDPSRPWSVRPLDGPASA
jgi:hypothetical protein